MSEEQKAHESEVFEQEVSTSDLDAVAGGGVTYWLGKDRDENNCVEVHERQFYNGSERPNCAATVEDDSWCHTNDACNTDAIVYQGMQSCKKAWR